MTNSQQQSLVEMLDQADKHFKAGEIAQAARLYEEVLPQAEQGPDSDLRDRARRGIAQVEARRRATAAASTVTEQDQRRIKELETEAERYLRQRSNNSFKQAREIFDRILAYDMPAEQRQLYEQRRRDVERQREAFLERFGQLLTARQMGSDTDELIEVRKLVEDGELVDADGRKLDDKYTDLHNRLTIKLIRSAQERVAAADEAQREGFNYLEATQFELARRNYGEAVEILEGRDIRSSLDRDRTPETILAERMIKQDIQQVADVRKLLGEYRAEQEKVERFQRGVARLRPMYQEAYTNHHVGNHRAAVSQLEEIQEHLSNLGISSGSSTLVNVLIKQARTMWESDVLTQVDILLEQARQALGRNDEQNAVIYANRVVRFQSQLSSEAIKDRCDEARAILLRVSKNTDMIRRLIKQGQEFFEQGKTREAVERFNEVLRIRNDFSDQDVQQALQRRAMVVDTGVGQVMRLVDQAEAEESFETLAKTQEAIERMRELVRDMNNLPRQSSLLAQLDQALDRLKQGTATVHQREQEREAASRSRASLRGTIQNMLEQSSDYRSGHRYDEAMRLLEEINQRLNQHPGHFEDLRALHDEMQVDVRGAWARWLRGQIYALLTMFNPPDARTALRHLERLQQLDPSARQDLSDLEQLALRQVAREEGLAAFKRRDFEQALKWLLQADPTDVQVQDTLRETRSEEARRLSRLQRWPEALVVLEQIDNPNEATQLLLRKTRFYLALEQVREQRTKAEQAGLRLDDEVLLIKAEDLSLGMPDASAEVHEERRRFKSVQERLNKIEQSLLRAEALYQTHASTSGGNCPALYDALQALNEALGLLSTAHPRRTELETKQRQYNQMYEQLVADTCRALYEQAQQHFAADQYDEALAALEEARQLHSSQLRNEREKLAQQISEALSKRLSSLTQQAEQILSNHTLSVSRIDTLLDQINQAAASGAQATARLSQTRQSLQQARNRLAQAEVELCDARRRWAQARQQGQRSKEAYEITQRVAGSFQDVRYRPELLNEEQPEHNLAIRMSRDEEALQQLEQIQQRLSTQLAAPPPLNADLFIRDFTRLQNVEQQIYIETQRLKQEVPEMLPILNTTNPQEQQLAVLRALIAGINMLVRTINFTSSGDGQIISQCLSLISVLERTNPGDRYGLKSEVETLKIA